MATFDQVVQEISAAAHAAGLMAPGGHVDTGHVESCLVHALRVLSQTIDLDAFKVVADPLVQTVESRHLYALPESFGRPTRPDDEGDSGIYVYDSDDSSPASLMYMDPVEMLRNRAAGEGRPAHFNIVGRQLHLHPTPDGVYYIAMIYIRSISAADFLAPDDVALPDHTYLRDACLAQMAMELGHPVAPALVQIAERARSQILNEELRAQQRFQYKMTNRFTSGRLSRSRG